MAVEKCDRVAIITVHGTFDAAESDEGEKWFQRGGSAFLKRLSECLKGHRVEADFFPHRWSGRNSVRSRERSAERLAKLIRERSRTHASVHVIGHSHGGNIANDAAWMLGWPKPAALQTLSSVTTVGTPFFRGEVSRADLLGAIVFLFLTVVTAIGVPIAIGTLVDRYGDYSPQRALMLAAHNARAELEHERVPLTEDAIAQRVMELLPAITERYEAEQDEIERWWVVGALSAASLVFALPLAWQGVRRVRRLRAKARTEAQVHAIWHAHDEAMAFLRSTEQMNFEAFPKGALWRGTRTIGVVWGARMVVSFVALALLISVLRSMGLQPVSSVMGVFGGAFDGLIRYLQHTPGGELVAMSVAVAPIVFVITYFTARIFGGFLPEHLARNAANNRIRRIVRAVAFGKDGDERIGPVSAQSHSFGTKDAPLSGEVAGRMRENASVAADKLLTKYRWEIFNLNAESAMIFRRIHEDIETWKSLIHTTYFDQPEIAVLVGDHIALEAARAAQRAKPAANAAPGPA